MVKIKERKPRYTIGQIVTTDASLCVMSDEVRQLGFSHEDIYVAGLKAIKERQS